MCPDVAIPAEQQEKDTGPLQPLVREGWCDLNGHLANLLSVAAQSLSSSSGPRRLPEMLQYESSKQTAHLLPPHQRRKRRSSRPHKRPPFCPPSLLALGHAAYPRMEQTVLDSLVLERLLSLAQELGVSFSIMEEDDLSSLKVAHCIQAHVNLQRWPRVAACMAVPEDVEEPAPREPQQACASFAQGPRGRKVEGRRPEQEQREKGPLPAWRSMIACFK
ncbi:unnamed protein product [Lampetra planeri]